MNAPDDQMPPADEVARLRVPPHSVEAEQSVLGGMLIDAAAAAAVRETLVDTEFYRHEHRLIYQAICDAVDVAGDDVDVVTVFERLQVMGKDRDIGGLAYLNALAQSVPSAANMKRYSAIVRERALLRRVIATSDEIATECFNLQGRSADGILDRTMGRFEALYREVDRKPPSTKLPMLSLDELHERAVAVRWLVKNLIPAESLGVLFGGSGTFKSFLALDLALHVTRGMPWLGRRTKQGQVIYVAAEGGTGLSWRSEAWHVHRRLMRKQSALTVVPVAMDLKAEAWRIVDTAKAKGITPVLVVVDTMSQTFRGEENSAAEVAAYLAELGSRFRDTWNCAVQLVHHTGHQETDRPRGSTTIRANTDYLYGVFRDEKEMLATMTCVHRKDGEPFEDAVFHLNKVQLGTDEDGDAVTSLAARHLSTAEEREAASEAEAKAGRLGMKGIFLKLVAEMNGKKEADLRRAFYSDCGAEKVEAQRKAYQRWKKWAMNERHLEIAEGYVLALKAVA